MIDLKDIKFRIHTRSNGYIDRQKSFHCWCPSCGKDKGYQTKSRYNKSPLCVKCATNTDQHREILRKNHWSQSGIYSPKQYVTEAQIGTKRQRELEWNRAYWKEYYQRNKTAIHAKRKKFENSNINHRLGKRLRTRLYLAIKGQYKSGSAVRDLGCSIDEFKKYMEYQFEAGMSWDNWGIKGWHIDHIVPLTHFDLTDREELLKAVHYSNLQPLWWKDNLSKGGVIDDVS